MSLLTSKSKMTQHGRPRVYLGWRSRLSIAGPRVAMPNRFLQFACGASFEALGRFLKTLTFAFWAQAARNRMAFVLQQLKGVKLIE
jgi:hypothetical protein